MINTLSTRIMEISILLFTSEDDLKLQAELSKLYTSYYTLYNKKENKPAKEVALIKGAEMMKTFFADAVLDDTKPKDMPKKKDITINLQSNYIGILIETFNNNNKFFDGYNESEQISMMLALIGLDHLLLTTLFEYGPKSLPFVLQGRLANTGQWWANMELHAFSDKSFTHADTLLKGYKNSSISHQLNGASALFPTNITYARFVDIVRGSPDSLSLLHKSLGVVSDDSFSGRSNMNEVVHNRFQIIITSYMFHIITLLNLESFRFENFYIGYYNNWRYNNFILRKNMGILIDGK